MTRGEASMSLVYSYVRFSTKLQMESGSKRRQTETGDKWIAKHGHTPAKMTLHDLGVSAFRGKNKHTGALSRFLEAIKEGRIAPGSILLVENLDRLSRDVMYEAQKLFVEILQADVMIAVTMPVERIYSKDTLESPISLLDPLMAFWNAHEESKKKSIRLKDEWIEKRKQALTGEKFFARCPCWMTWVKHEKQFVLNDGVQAIRFIFSAAAEGMGQTTILAELVKRFEPIGRSRRWNKSFITMVLNDRSVLGELQPKTRAKDGKRIADGPAIPDYYPAAIDEKLWYRAQSAKANNTKATGPSADFINIFVGLVFNAHDGSKMHVQASPQRRSAKQRRLISYSYLCKEKHADGVSVQYDLFEKSLLRYVSEIKPEDMESKLSINTVREKEQELSGIEKRIARIENDLSTTDDDGEYQSLRNAIKLATKNRDIVKDELEKLRGELHADQPLAQTHNILNALESATGEDLRKLRIRLRSMLPEFIESIYVKPEKHYHRVYCLVQINYHNGNFRQIDFGPGFYGGAMRQVKPEEFSNEYNLDLRDKEQAKKVVFAGWADMLTSASPVEVPTTIPNTLGGAVAVWILHCQATLSHESFRMVRPMIKRFIEFIGGDLPLSAINSHRWRQWTEHLKRSDFAANTRLTVYGRSREFIRWAITKDLCSSFPELEVSAGKTFKTGETK